MSSTYRRVRSVATASENCAICSLGGPSGSYFAPVMSYTNDVNSLPLMGARILPVSVMVASLTTRSRRAKRACQSGDTMPPARQSRPPLAIVDRSCPMSISLDPRSNPSNACCRRSSRFSAAAVAEGGGAWPPGSDGGGRVVADTNNFIWNRWWNFKSKGRLRVQYPQFLWVSIDGLMLNLILLKLLKEDLLPSAGLGEDSASFYILVAQVIAIFLVSVFNFFVNALWTFRADMRPKSQSG